MKILLRLFMLCCFLSCSEKPKELKHSFFVAGHVYGSPVTKSKNKGVYKSLHKPFVDKFKFLESQAKLDKGFLLGDVVYRPKDWGLALKTLDSLDVPLEIVRGNHDGNIRSFEKKFNKSYKEFTHQNNLYIVLDTNIDSLSIKNEQLAFLRQTLNDKTDQIDNVFVMSHHLFWYSKDKIPEPYANSMHKREDKLNFWTEIEPLFRAIDKNVYIFSGDAGAFKRSKTIKNKPSYYYHQYQNMTFIATGMGAGLKDNLVIADVFDDGSVEFRLIYLNGNDINGLGKLEDYSNNN